MPCKSVSEMEQCLPKIWNTLIKEFELLACPCMSSLRHGHLENVFPHLKYSSFLHRVALWFSFPKTLLLCRCINEPLNANLQGYSFIKHIVSFTHQSVKCWFRGLNSSCWSNYTRPLLSNLQSNQVWRPFVQRHNFEGVSRLTIF